MGFSHKTFGGSGLELDVGLLPLLCYYLKTVLYASAMQPQTGEWGFSYMHDLAGTGGGHTLSLMARIWRPSIISPIGVTSRSIFDRRSKANGNNEFSLLSRSDIFLAAHSRRSYDCVKTPPRLQRSRFSPCVLHGWSVLVPHCTFAPFKPIVL